MTTPPPYTLTHESVTVVWSGKPYTVQRGSPNYNAIRTAIINEDWDAIGRNLTVRASLKEWAKGEFDLRGNSQFVYKGEDVPDALNSRMVEMANRGENPGPLFKFWERLQKNPSFRSVQQLFPFLKHEGIPLTEDGCFLAYKSIRADYKDKHSGKFDNTPGATNQMDRNKVSDDPNVACHEGFHVGALAYVRDFGGPRIVICKVDPADVVCVPFDSSQHKMRVCKYKVIGQHSGQMMPNTVIKDSDLPDHAKNWPDQETGKVNVITDEPTPPSEAAAETEEEDFDITEDETPEADETEETSEEETSAGPKLIAKRWQKYQNMDLADLMKCSLDELRQYAGKGLEIVGASKIPGGKTALVARIMEVRT
jgi:hypothetical protein